MTADEITNKIGLVTEELKTVLAQSPKGPVDTETAIAHLKRVTEVQQKGIEIYHEAVMYFAGRANELN